MLYTFLKLTESMDISLGILYRIPFLFHHHYPGISNEGCNNDKHFCFT